MLATCARRAREGLGAATLIVAGDTVAGPLFAVPEPGTLLLVGLAVLVLWFAIHKRRP